MGERSQGKVRPMLPRASDLPVIRTRTERDPSVGRGPGGRFAPGNGVALGRGAKAAVRRLLGRSVEITDAEALAVARDADRLYSATLAELPSDGAIVRQLAALYCRHVAIGSYWSAKASVSGLGTTEGLAAQEQATKHGTRAERLAVTTLDIATRLAQAARARAADPFAVVDAQVSAMAAELERGSK